MDKKIRLMVIGLIAITVVSIISAFYILGSKEVLRREYLSVRETLTKENESLAKKANQALEEKRNFEEKLGALKKELDRIQAERQELQTKYEVVNKERDELLEKFKKGTMLTGSEAQPSALLVTPPTEETYWAGVLKEKAELAISLSSLKEALSRLKIIAEELKKDKQALELEIKNLNQDRQHLESRLSYTQQLVDSLSTELVREKNDKYTIENELNNLKKEQSALTRKFNALNEEKFSLEKKLQLAQESKAELDKRLQEANAMLEKKVVEIEEIKRKIETAEGKAASASLSQRESVELPPIVVRSEEAPQATAKEPKKLIGKVLAVNREHNFVVIDLGEEQGIKPGQLFDVIREGKSIATVEVIQTRKSVSACDIKEQDTNVWVGDTVK